MTNLPNELKSADAFFGFLGVKAKERAFLRQHSSYRYRIANIPKRRGGTRTLIVPERRLKFLQRQTLSLLEKLYVARAPVHGFVRGRGVLSNASEHQKRPFLLNIDLQNYFGTITRRRVRGVLLALGLDEEVVEGLCSICVTRNQLPQGAPTSPILSNMIAYRLDRVLMAFAKENRLRYTRYADDISLSSYVQPTALFEGSSPPTGRVDPVLLSASLKQAIASNGFQINPEKVWFSGPNSRKEVTGLVVNEFPNIKRKFLRDVRAALYKVETLGAVDAENDYQKRYKTDASLKQVLRGRLEWIAQVRGRSFSAYRTLGHRFNKQFPDARLPIHPTYEEVAERAVWVVEYFSGSVCNQGTAFFLDGVGLVTADHVLKGLPSGESAELYRPTEPAKRFKAAPSAKRSVERDLLILEHDIPLGGFLALEAGTLPERKGSDILALGFPDYGPGDELSTRPGYIVARTTKHGVKFIEVSATLSGGISGGPIVNDRYQVVAVAQRGGKDEHKQLAVAVSELLSLAAE